MGTVEVVLPIVPHISLIADIGKERNSDIFAAEVEVEGFVIVNVKDTDGLALAFRLPGTNRWYALSEKVKGSTRPVEKISSSSMRSRESG